MIKVRYTPGHNGRGTFNGVSPGEVTEVSKRDFERFRSVYTPIDSPKPEQTPEPAAPEPSRERVVDLLPVIRESEDEDWLREQSKDPRSTIANAATARLKAIDGSADHS